MVKKRPCAHGDLTKLYLTLTRILCGEFMLRSLKPKLVSLVSISQVYDNWLGILRVYFFGGETSVSLHDLRGGKLPFKVSKDNVERTISLGNVLAKLQDRYEVRNDEIRCRSFPNITIKPDFTGEELSLLRVLYSLSKYVTGIVRFNDNHLVTDIEGGKWIVRSVSPVSLKFDMLFGPLLSFYQEPREYEWFLNALQRGGTFVDVGANVGGYSVRACKMGARVIALEPDPDNYRVLKLNLELNQCTNANILNIAAASKEEVRQLYESDKGAPVGYTLEQGNGVRKVKCSVEAKSLDVAILPLLGDECVDLLKVDVEGLEVEVIKGSLNLLNRTRYVMVEVIPSTESKMREVLGLLRPLGFKLIDKIFRQSLYCDLFLGKSM